jgi:plastocyanin
MNKGILLVVGALAVIVIVGGGAYFVMKKKSSSAETPTPTPEVVVGESPTTMPATSPTTSGTAMQPDTSVANAVKFTVEGSNFKFVPAVLKVKKGDTVEITFKNTGGTHNFMIDEFSVATNKIGDGEEETVTFVADKTGKFDYYCSVGNHRAMGMQGVLTVE